MDRPLTRARAAAIGGILAIVLGAPVRVATADDAKPAPTITPLGYVEASYSYNLGRPSNGLTSYRAFDDRHDTFNLENVALGVDATSDPFETRVLLQVGNTPSTYYASEPNRPGAAGVSATSDALWKYLQEAWVSYEAPIGRGLRLQAGLFLSPIGPETIPIKDSWNWSRSNLFFGLPAYHTGVRGTYDVAKGLSATVAVYNGWNSVVDDNAEKSVSASLAYEIPDSLLVQALYFGGVERPTGAPEGPSWRHDFDGYVRWDMSPRVSVMAHANGGWEVNRFGLSNWYAGALYDRVKIVSWLFFAGRVDRFWEDVASNASGRATPIFWPAGWVSSATATLDARPHSHVSVRLEYRHDQADQEIYFRGSVAGDGSAAAPYVPNARRQDTVTFGVTGWL